MTPHPTPAQPPAAKEVFDMKIDELRSEYLLASGRAADVAIHTRKPQLKAEILLFRAGVPEHLHDKLREKVIHLNTLRVDHLRAQAFQKMIPGTLTRQETVERMIQRMREKIGGKASRTQPGTCRAPLTSHRTRAELTTARSRTSNPWANDAARRVGGDMSAVLISDVVLWPSGTPRR
ncbi:hypothetical protein KVR01_007538 [Diaporthe batatas]|uniref:uncharacterized protein n=1 Tax=Diaporthe batatas TaxID=748121 RepID=UPI001D05427D|nr:uncharacterized protein KVR01_007538 [Diaporthe batatas]KAG8163060.1 hypothetical protein KVR01_007538 [Diaporthe batatas]